VLQAVFADDIDRNFEPLLSSAIQVVSVILPVLGILLGPASGRSAQG
jgi:hypothetical protein